MIHPVSKTVQCCQCDEISFCLCVLGTTFANNKTDSKWYHFDDATVSVIYEDSSIVVRFLDFTE